MKSKSRLGEQSALSGLVHNPLVVGVLLFTLFILILAIVQFSSPDLAGTDGYYHIKYASLMRTEGLRPEFPWLSLTILNPREFYDHHFLFHVFMVPFTFGDLRVGAKWVSVIFTSIAFLSVWWLLKKQNVPYAELWSLGLFLVSEAFLYRMSMARVQSLSLAFLILGIHWMLTRKYKLLLVLSFLYVWLYDAFPLLLILAGIYTISVVIVERQVNLQPLMYVGLGTGIGLIINPYFPYDIIFIYRHILPKLVEPTTISVGSEWYPYKTTQLVENSFLAIAAFLSGAFALGLKKGSMDVRTAASFLTAIFFGALLFQSRRFIEYFPTFALIFAAMAWAPLLKNESSHGSISSGLNKHRFPLLDGMLARISRRQVVLVVILVGLLIYGIINIRETQGSIQGAKPYSRYSGAANWLEENTPIGSRVFQTDWDDFPRLFYHNTHNTYLIGLDPTYMQLYNAELYKQWVDITEGEIEEPSRYIYSRFGSDYVFTDLKHKRFAKQAEEDPNLIEVYRDEEAIVYQVLH